jgi:uncharacterized protein
MPEFKIFAAKTKAPSNARSDNPLSQAIFYYNSEDSTLLDENRNPVIPINAQDNQKIGWNWTKNNPATKIKAVRHLKISLGLSCNYSCSYCSQRFIPNADETTKKDVPEFLEKFSSWYDGGEDGLGKGTKIEFWGGEPFVYWKTLKPLAEEIRKKYTNMDFGIITNGTILDDEKIDWLDNLNFGVGLSHDGPGYHVRGLDPLEDVTKREMIMKLYNRLAPKGRISINAMLHNENSSRAAIQEHLYKHFGENLTIGEGGFIDAYDGGGLQNSLNSPKDQIEFRRKAIKEINLRKAERFIIVGTKINNFIKTIYSGKKKTSVTQKCGIDNPNSLTVDLKGNVITCQNVSSVSTSNNGESHKAGSVYDFDNIKMKSITTWQNRKNCPKCPVLHICQASCTFLDNKLFQASCENSYSDNIVFLALGIQELTGYLPYRVEGQSHRPDREDIWGLNGYPEPYVFEENQPKEDKKYNFKYSVE